MKSKLIPLPRDGWAHGCGAARAYSRWPGDRRRIFGGFGGAGSAESQAPPPQARPLAKPAGLSASEAEGALSRQVPAAPRQLEPVGAGDRVQAELFRGERRKEGLAAGADHLAHVLRSQSDCGMGPRLHPHSYSPSRPFPPPAHPLDVWDGWLSLGEGNQKVGTCIGLMDVRGEGRKEIPWNLLENWVCLVGMRTSTLSWI